MTIRIRNAHYVEESFHIPGSTHPATESNPIARIVRQHTKGSTRTLSTNTRRMAMDNLGLPYNKVHVVTKFW